MRYTTLLPFAATATAFVIPDDVTAAQLALNPESSHNAGSWWDSVPSLNDFASSVEDTFSSTVDAFEAGYKSLLDSTSLADALGKLEVEIPDFLPSSWMERPGKGRKGHHGHHGHGATNLTIYQAIQMSKYSTKFAKLVDEYPDIVTALNSTEHNITAFVPTDKAFEKIPDHHEKPSKEFIEAVLQYHLVPGLASAKRLFFSHTLPTTLTEEALGGQPQRLRFSVGLFGIRVNFYSRIVVGNLFTKNGVIHGVDSILVPPPRAGRIISLFPSKFSTLLLAFQRTELGKELHGMPTTGATFFSPTNRAFAKLGPGANAFLFNTDKGLGYLKALLKYHTVANETLYSDAYYGRSDRDADVDVGAAQYHVDLPTLLEGKALSIDVARWGHFITVKINGFTRVAIQDGISKDGVVHVLNSVLIPPHPRKTEAESSAYVDGDEIEVEELIERLEPYLEGNNNNNNNNKKEKAMTWGFFGEL